MPPRFRQPSAAVLAARARRQARAREKQVKFEWYLDNVSDKVRLTMKQRMRIATTYVKDKVVKNISRPVTVGTGARSNRRVVTDRSKPGEYPKADTKQLMRTIFDDMREVNGSWEGYVGTPEDYGLILETSKKLKRRFLQRTLDEERATVTRILTGPIRT